VQFLISPTEKESRGWDGGKALSLSGEREEENSTEKKENQKRGKKRKKDSNLIIDKGTSGKWKGKGGTDLP